MKAELIETKHGIALQITALSTDDKMKLASFMQARKQAHKPRLKILHSPEHSSILNIGFVLPVTKKYLMTIEGENTNTDGLTRVAFPPKLQEVNDYMVIHRSNGVDLLLNTNYDVAVMFAAVANYSDMTLTYKERIYSVANIEKLKREM